MARRLFDVVLAGIALVLALPVLLVAAAGIRLSSPGPVLYRAVRVGRGGRPFVMYKLRTMHSTPREAGSAITARGDARVFPFGAWLRRFKLDELPQLFNVLRGEMAVVGPRPEDPKFVADCYTPRMRETLTVTPGLASPGSLYSTTHGDAWLSAEQPERDYVEKLLPLKLALDLVYVRRASLAYDLAVLGRTAGVLAARALGRRRFPIPPEMDEARRLLAPAEAPRRSTPR